jgi:sporulation protein YhbH
MSTFREHKTIADRSAADRKRHKKKIEKALQEGIKDVVAEETIIGQDGNKKVKIPVKGIKEYQFVYGDNEDNSKAGSAPGKDIKKGQILKRRGNKSGKAAGKKGSNEAGEEYYEVEVTLEELAEYLFAELELPDLDKKRFKFLKDKKLKRSGYRKKGLRSKLSKKETLKRKLKRKKRAIAAGTYDPEAGERFPFHEDDLKYKHMKEKQEENNSAVIFFLMDVSGSMDKDKKYLARSFYFLLYQFLRYKYDNIDVVFISHSSEAKEVNEEEFFQRSTFGGTLMSTALEMEKEIISKRYHPSNWNIYTFYCGDGENWSVDNKKTIDLFRELKELNQMICYAEINPNLASFNPTLFNTYGAGYEEDPGGLWPMLLGLLGDNFKRLKISEGSQIWPSFVKLFGGSGK